MRFRDTLVKVFATEVRANLELNGFTGSLSRLIGIKTRQHKSVARVHLRLHYGARKIN